MTSINAQVRLRPARFAFLVRPNDRKRLLKIFQTNTCLWGGQFNPIIPFFKQLPKWWDRHNNHFENATQIINGYLDFFEPDFLVEAEKGLANSLGFERGRVLQIEDILTLDGDRDRQGFGQSVFDLYRDLYRKEFQFAHRHEHNIVDITPESRKLKEFCACMFGAFPEEQDLKYLHKGFTDVFTPKVQTLGSRALAELYKSSFTSALRIGRSEIEVHYHDHRDPALFILDTHEPRDLIDFWNLRAVTRNVLPIPVQWIEALSDFCRDYILENYRPLPGNPNGVMIRPTVMFSRSIPTTDIEDLHKKHLRVDVDGANCRQDWYPSIWRSSPNFTHREMRPTLSADEKSFDSAFIDDKPEIHFDVLAPDFSEKYGNSNCYANVVTLNDHSYKNQIATTFPCNFKNPVYPNFGLGGNHLLPTTEGLVTFPKYKDLSKRWELPCGSTAISNWLEKIGIKCQLSDAGKATQQIIQTLGGFWGVANFANAEIVRWLNEISRRPVSRSAHHQEFRNRINNATKANDRHERNFKGLVERGAVELGLEVKCTKCSNWSWYSLKNLDQKIDCSRCLQQFNFPNIDPSSINTRWAYRLVGPFALPDYAKGGYAASLSIRFFSEVIGQFHEANTTWSAGQTLELEPKIEIESDFILWYQRQQFFGNNFPTEVVFGEAKSFGKEVFKAEDIDRMKTLACRFPGSVVVFSTMKQAADLSTDEIKRIAKFAEWGREYIKERQQTRAPVIMLTGTELFAGYSLQNAWEEVGGRHADIVRPAYIRLENLRVLADLTQQLYLKMPSYHTWLDEKNKKRLTRKKP
ncbi:hypothetical protein [Geopsychrobacter electrodiphilus]|uniref:hypothetical protein n=1 Tax=Geopsychrobacter electrodiphilus TaxID=225196 RepID=UPI000381A605|nr:hypothetical protein [Geopsychrobacter electrodiphilus]